MDKAEEREKQKRRMEKRKDEQNKDERVKEHDKKIKQEQEQKIIEEVEKTKDAIDKRFSEIKSDEKYYASQYDKHNFNQKKSDIEKVVESFEKKTTEEKSKGFKEFRKTVYEFFGKLNEATGKKYYIEKKSVIGPIKLKDDYFMGNFKDEMQITPLIDDYKNGSIVNKPIEDAKTETKYKTIFIYKKNEADKGDVFIRLCQKKYEPRFKDNYELKEVNLLEFIKTTHKYLMPNLITNLFGFIQKNNLCTLDKAETNSLSSLKDKIIEFSSSSSSSDEDKFENEVTPMLSTFVELIKTGLEKKKDGSNRKSQRKSNRKSQRRSRRKSRRKSKRKSNRKSKRRSNRKSKRRSN